MKLRVRINKQTSRVELLGEEEPSLTQLKVHIQETVLSAHGISPDTEFSLSLNGTEPLSDVGQTLSSCGVVSGDLICVVLPPSAAAASPSSVCQTSAGAATQRKEPNRTEQSAAMSSSEQSASNPVPPREPEGESEVRSQGAEASSWEPMLCSEAESGQAPLSLELLYHGAQRRSHSDSLMVVVNLLMLETGFTPQGSEVKPGEMPGGWTAAGGVYRLTYTHPLCGNSLAMVVAVTMGPKLVVNATLKTNETVDTVRKLSLNPHNYVTTEWPGESAAAVFKNLAKLSRVFKDQLVYPLIAAAREAMALPAAFGLSVLPPELLLRVLRLLDVRSLVALSAASRHFHGAMADPTLWRRLYHRDFEEDLLDEEAELLQYLDRSRSRETDWKELYKWKYEFSKDVARRRFDYFRPTYPVDPFNPAPFHPPYPPGIIGGEYDQRPNIGPGFLPRPRYDPIGPLPIDPNFLPRPRYDPIGPLPIDPAFYGRRGRGLRPAGGRPGDFRPGDVRRGFI